MENQNNQQQINEPTQVVNTPLAANQPPVPVAAIPEAAKPKGKLTDLIKDVYTNIKGKKIFKLLAILFGIIFFIIIIGSIYSIVKNSRGNKTVLSSPSPVATAQVILTEESKKSKSVLEELKNRILNLDINQKHLTPPSIDFNISF